MGKDGKSSKGKAASAATRKRVSKKETPSKSSQPQERVFKNTWFDRAAGAAGVSDKELLEAVDELRKGQGDKLGRNLWKKRISENKQRAIVVTKRGVHWIFVFLFEKQDKGNLDDAELAAYKKLAKDYEKLDNETLNRAVKEKTLVEISNDGKSTKQSD